jgi:PAS domain S-box-containing protein
MMGTPVAAIRPSSWLLLAVWVAAALSLLAIYGVVRQNVTQTRTLVEETDLVMHTLEVEQALESVMLELTTTESQQRTYLLAGSETAFQSYTAAVARVPGALERLVGLADDNPDQVDRIERLRQMAQERLASLQQYVALRQFGGLEAVLAGIDLNAGRNTMNEVRALALEISSAEAALLRSRREQAALAYRAAVGGRIGSGFVSALLLLGMATLVTSRVRAQERVARQIAEDREHLKVTLSSIGDGVIATDVHGCVALMNGVACTLTGWTEAEAIGRPVHEVFAIVSEETRRPVENPVTKVLREGKIQGLANHTVLIARDGSERPIDDSGAPIRGVDGSLRGTVLVFRDVADRRAHEQALLDSERRYRAAAEREQAARAQAEEANRLKDEFLAMLSHELRTPLNAVLGWTQILQTGALGEATEARALASIRRNAEAQQRLVEDLLDVSRIVTAKFPLDRRPFDIGSAVTAAVDAVRPDTDAKHVILSADVEGPFVVNADPYRVQQVALNLLTNALKFTPAGGRIDVVLQSAPGGVRLLVRDTGQGIAPDLLPYMFDRFRQGDGSSTRAHGGLGLGLAIAKHIVEAHDGIIVARSDGVDCGASFEVYLPAADVSTDSTNMSGGMSDVAAGDGRLTGILALVVDDETDSRELLDFALKQAGADVLVAATSQQALDLLATHRPSVILTDVQMPDMDGFELIRAIRERFRDQAPPAIAITARAHTDDTLRAARAGFAAHITKPVNLDRLTQTIRAVTRRAAKVP